MRGENDMKRQAVIAATFIIVMLAVAVIYVNVASAQKLMPSSHKSTASAQQPTSSGGKSHSYYPYDDDDDHDHDHDGWWWWPWPHHWWRDID